MKKLTDKEMQRIHGGLCCICLNREPGGDIMGEFDNPWLSKKLPDGSAATGFTSVLFIEDCKNMCCKPGGEIGPRKAGFICYDSDDLKVNFNKC